MKSNRMIWSVLAVAALMITSGGAAAQDCAGFENFPGGAEEGKQTHVLYRDFIEKEQYEDAIPMWEQLMAHSPAGHVYHFIDGVKIYKYLIERDAENEELVEGYKDKVAALYEQRLRCLSSERGDSNLVMESFAYELAAMGYSNTDKTLATFEQAIALNGNKTSSYILAYYGDFAAFMFGNDAMAKEKARDIFLKLESIKDANSGKVDYQENWEYVLQYYEPYEDYLFDCGYFADKLKPQYLASPDNPDVFREVLRALLLKNCDPNDAFMRELIVKDSLYIVRVQDSLDRADREENPDNYGKRLLSNGDENAAIPYFEKAIAMDISAQRRASANYYLAKIYHSKGGSNGFAKARSYYEAAASLKPDWGDPYYQIGLMYASSGPLCGTGTGWESQIVIWPATDAWNKAIATGDAEAAAKAREKINYYHQFLPTREDAFQRSVSEGASYKIPCWIQRSSTVRLRSQY